MARPRFVRAVELSVLIKSALGIGPYADVGPQFLSARPSTRGNKSTGARVIELVLLGYFCVGTRNRQDIQKGDCHGRSSFKALRRPNR
jgi:hypothetical protein